MKYLIPVSFLLSTSLMAAIIGEDDRLDTKLSSAKWQEIAKSVPAMVQKNRIIPLADGRFELTGKPMTQIGLCTGEIYSEEKSIANCSASFIGKNKILTAAHCFDDQYYACNTYSVVFDYARSEIPMNGAHIVDKSQVYNCKNIQFSKFDQRIAGIDLAIIELDRDVEGREPIKLNLKQNLRVNEPLVMIGYPLGISQKVVEGGKVLKLDKKNVSFKHDLDAFSVNSGGPIFSSEGTQVGVLVRGTGSNIDYFTDRDCGGWGLGTEGRDFSEGNDLSPLAKVLKSENR